MKLPFSIGSKVAFRVFIPGFLLAAFLYPLVRFTASSIGIPLVLNVYLLSATLVSGWFLLLLDMPMYMLLEGRAYWPRALRKLGIHLEDRRIARLKRQIEAARKRADNARATELALELYKYPLLENGGHKALYPTRLGNVIAEYERYPTLKYGADGVFYWHRIWLDLDKDLRNELDERQALVDGTVYVICVLLAGCLICLAYAIASWKYDIAVISSLSRIYIWLAALGLPLVAWMIYRVSLSAHVEYGRYFKAMFDQKIGGLDLSPALESLAETINDVRVKALRKPEAYRAVWRYLHWHRFRRVGEDSQDIAMIKSKVGARGTHSS
jgi:hypothetical protein